MIKENQLCIGFSYANELAGLELNQTLSSFLNLFL